jgi:hypothetical protein
VTWREPGDGSSDHIRLSTDYRIAVPTLIGCIVVTRSGEWVTRTHSPGPRHVTGSAVGTRIHECLLDYASSSFFLKIAASAATRAAARAPFG